MRCHEFAPGQLVLHVAFENLFIRVWKPCPLNTSTYTWLSSKCMQVCSYIKSFRHFLPFFLRAIIIINFAFFFETRRQRGESDFCPAKTTSRDSREHDTSRLYWTQNTKYVSFHRWANGSSLSVLLFSHASKGRRRRIFLTNINFQKLNCCTCTA